MGYESLSNHPSFIHTGKMRGILGMKGPGWWLQNRVPKWQLLLTTNMSWISFQCGNEEQQVNLNPDLGIA